MIVHIPVPWLWIWWCCLFQTDMAGDVNPMIRQWMSAMVSQQLHRILPTITITDQELQHYIVRSQQQTPTTSSTTTTAATAQSAPPLVAMETASCQANNSASASVAESEARPSSPTHSQSSEASFVSAEGDERPASSQVTNIKYWFRLWNLYGELYQEKFNPN